MASVEKVVQKPPVIIGYGTKPQEADLRTAGAEEVLFHPHQLQALIDMANVALRPVDTLLMVQPGLLTRQEMRLLLDACDRDLLFQVVGHDAYPLTTDRTLAAWRKLTPRGVQTPIKALTGRPGTVPYSLEQADAIIRLWHARPRKKPLEVTALAETILKLEPGSLPRHWVRDMVIKFVGTAKRDKPDGWQGIEHKPNNEDQAE